MITKDYAAIRYQMANAPSITSQLATDTGGNPIIVYGRIPEEYGPDALPAISFHRVTMDNRYGVRDGTFVINCFAATEHEALDLAEAVNELFRDSIGSADGYALKTDSSMQGAILDPSEIIQIPVTVRVITT